MAVNRQDAGQYQAAIWQATVASQAQTVIGVSWEMGWLSSGLPACSSPSGMGCAWWGQSSFILVMSKFLNFISISFLWMPSGCQIFLSLYRRFMQCMLSILSCYHLPLLLLWQTPITESKSPFMTITWRLFLVVIIKHSFPKSDGWLLIFMIS